MSVIWRGISIEKGAPASAPPALEVRSELHVFGIGAGEASVFLGADRRRLRSARHREQRTTLRLRQPRRLRRQQVRDPVLRGPSRPELSTGSTLLLRSRRSFAPSSQTGNACLPLRRYGLIDFEKARRETPGSAGEGHQLHAEGLCERSPGLLKLLVLVGRGVLEADGLPGDDAVVETDPGRAAPST